MTSPRREYSWMIATKEMLAEVYESRLPRTNMGKPSKGKDAGPPKLDAERTLEHLPAMEKVLEKIRKDYVANPNHVPSELLLSANRILLRCC